MALVLAALLWLSSQALAQQGEGRMALVVGNTANDGVPSLPLASRDAREIASALERQSFEVTLLLNSDRATFAAAFDSFARRAGSASLALVYFGGYGVRAEGENHLLPIDVSPDSVETVRARSIALEALIARLAGPERPTVFVLDANQPFNLPAETGLAAGLGAPVPGPETLIAMATQPGVPADAGEANAFTAALIEGLALSGQPFDRIMADVTETVRRVTYGRQVPWMQAAVSAPVFLDPFVPDEEDFARLAAMPERQRSFLLEVWRSQGAVLGAETMARLAAMPADPAEAEAEAEPAPQIERAKPQFSFEFLEDTPEAPASPEAAPNAEPPVVALTVPEAPAPEPTPPESPATSQAPAPAGEAVVALTAPGEPAAPLPLTEQTPPAPEPATVAALPVLPVLPRSAPEAATPKAAPAATVRASVNLSAVDAAPRAAARDALKSDPPGVALTMLAARAVHTRPFIADQPITRMRSESAPVLLASLGPSRSIAPQPDEADRLIGRDVTDHDLLVPEDLPRAVQTELARLGCYTAGVDGIWGRGSEGAVRRYVDARETEISGLDPTPELWRELKEVTGVVCTAPAPVPRADPAPRRSQPVARSAPAQRQAPAARAPDPAPSAPAAGGGRLQRSLGNVFR